MGKYRVVNYDNVVNGAIKWGNKYQEHVRIEPNGKAIEQPVLKQATCMYCDGVLLKCSDPKNEGMSICSHQLLREIVLNVPKDVHLGFDSDFAREQCLVGGSFCPIKFLEYLGFDS